MSNDRNSQGFSNRTVLAAAVAIVCLAAFSALGLAIWSYHTAEFELPGIPKDQPEWAEGLTGDVVIEVNSNGGTE